MSVLTSLESKIEILEDPPEHIVPTTETIDALIDALKSTVNDGKTASTSFEIPVLTPDLR